MATRTKNQHTNFILEAFDNNSTVVKNDIQEEAESSLLSKDERFFVEVNLTAFSSNTKGKTVIFANFEQEIIHKVAF